MCIVFFLEIVALSRANFGQGSGPIYMDDVACSGTESRLIDCVYDRNTTEDTHTKDAGVHCQLLFSTFALKI